MAFIQQPIVVFFSSMLGVGVLAFASGIYTATGSRKQRNN